MRRAFRIARWVALPVVGLLLCLGAGFALLQTRWAGDRMWRAVAPLIADSVAGQISLASLQLDGLTVVIEGLAVRTPSGELVLSTGRVTAKPRLGPLLQGRLILTAAEIHDPGLFVRIDQRGLNLSRALALRSPRQPDASPVLRSFAVRRLLVARGSVSFRDERRPPGARPPPLRAHQINLESNGEFGFEPRRLRIEGEAKAHVTAPVDAPARLALQVDGAGGETRSSAHLTIGDSSTSVRLALSGKSAQLELERLRLAPDLVHGVFPWYQAKVPLLASGSFGKQDAMLSLDAKVRAGSGQITATGRLDLAAWTAHSLEVKGRGIDLAALLPDAPSSAIDFSTSLRGGGRNLDDLTGALSVHVPRTRIGDRMAGPVHVSARAEAGRVELDQLVARLPGFQLEGSAVIGAANVRARGRVRADDLARTLAELLGPSTARQIPLRGRGHLRFAIDGPRSSPGLRAHLDFAELGYQEFLARSLEGNLRVRDLTRLRTGSLRVAAKRLRLGRDGLVLGYFALRIAQSPQRRVSFAASAAGPFRWSLRGQGVISRGRDALTLHELRLALLPAIWRLQGRARLGIMREGFYVRRLALQSGEQHLSIDHRQAGHRLTSKVTGKSIELAQLPWGLWPRQTPLRGRLDLSISAAGPIASPRWQAEIGLEDGHLRGLGALAVSLSGRQEGGRITGSGDGSIAAGTFAMHFSVPARWPPGRHQPLEARFNARAMQLSRLAAARDWIARLLPKRKANAVKAATVAGTVDLGFSISGTVARPTIDLQALASDFVVQGHQLGRLRLTLHEDPRRAIAAAFRGTGPTHQLDVTLHSRASLALFHDGFPNRDRLLQLPFAVRASASRLSLPMLASLTSKLTGRGGQRLQEGRGAFSLTLRGPLRAPTGELSLEARDVAAARLPKTDALAHILLDESEAGVRFTGRILRRGRALFTAEGTAALPSTRIASLAALRAAALTIDARVGPIRFQRLHLRPAADLAPARRLTGQVVASLSLRGSIDAPRFSVKADARNVSLEGLHLGEVTAQAGYHHGQTRVSLQARSGAGTLDLRASAAAQLGLAALQRGLDPRNIPIEAHLRADDFDLACFSAFHPEVQEMAGSVAADLRLAGPVASPRVRGRLAWTDGRVVTTSNGTFEDIHLALQGNADRVVLEELAVRSADGRLRITGHATRNANANAGISDLSLEMNLRKFPLVAETQPVATVTGAVVFTGQLGAKGLRMNARIPEAHVRLVSKAGKEVQRLAQAPDIVVFRDGTPINPRQADKYHALLDTPDEPGTAATRTAESDDPFSARIAVDASRNLWVRGDDINLELGLGPRFVVIFSPEPRIFGTLLVKRGDLEVLGRRLSLREASTVHFNGPPTRPDLDVEAVYEARKAEMTVLVQITGDPANLSFSLRSPERPDLSESDLITVLLTGRPVGEQVAPLASSSAQAASLLGGFIAGRLERVLRNKLPLDVFAIEPGTGLEGTQLEAGTYVRDDLYVAYVGRIGTDPFRRQNRNEVQLEYQLSRRWSFEASYGDTRRGSADLVWTKFY